MRVVSSRFSCHFMKHMLISSNNFLAAAGWNAIMGDSGRIDLIQTDFPSASSTLYLGDTGSSADPPRLSPMVNAPMPALISNAVIGDDSIDQATKSMSKLYVNSVCCV